MDRIKVDYHNHPEVKVEGFRLCRCYPDLSFQNAVLVRAEPFPWSSDSDTRKDKLTNGCPSRCQNQTRRESLWT